MAMIIYSTTGNKWPIGTGFTNMYMLKEKYFSVWQDQNPRLGQPPQSYINILRLQKTVLEDNYALLPFGPAYALDKFRGKFEKDREARVSVKMEQGLSCFNKCFP